MASARAAGHVVTDDINGEVPEGFTKVDITVKDGVRSSAANCYLKPAMDRPNLTVRTHCLAHRVVIENGRAVGVEYSTGGQVHVVRADREVVLCGGAYNSPQVLMLSGIGPADELAAHGDQDGAGTCRASARTCRSTSSPSSSSRPSSRSPS
ncbi:MAG: GMC family oxidoreductase N-terminal domain-containing protein [Caulobacteraceae bacterium]